MNELPNGPANDLAALERRYRRLLACYPRAFRRENGEEILAVLLACAEDGQRRPGPSASADLVRGAVRMRLRMAGQPPRAVRSAIRLMYAGLVAQLAALVIYIVTLSSVRSAVGRRYPGLAAQHALNVNVAIHYIAVPVALAAWLILLRALVRGRYQARFGLAAYFAVTCLSLAIAIGQESAQLAPADLIAGGVQGLITLAATALLFTAASSRYYRPEPRPVTPWRGTFGTM
jgi:hypothetical protein